MRPIVCRERKIYTVTMYSIRMVSWIGHIYGQLKQEYREAFDWPLSISKLHTAKCLDDYSLASSPQIA